MIDYQCYKSGLYREIEEDMDIRQETEDFFVLTYKLPGREYDSDISISFGGFRGKHEPTINWSAHGSQNIEATKTFIEALQKAVEFAEFNK